MSSSTGPTPEQFDDDLGGAEPVADVLQQKDDENGTPYAQPAWLEGEADGSKPSPGSAWAPGPAWDIARLTPPLHGLPSRWYFIVYSAEGARAGSFYVTASSSAEAVELAAGRCDPGQLLSAPRPWLPSWMI